MNPSVPYKMVNICTLQFLCGKIQIGCVNCNDADILPIGYELNNLKNHSLKHKQNWYVACSTEENNIRHISFEIVFPVTYMVYFSHLNSTFALTLFDIGKNQNLSKLNKTSVVEQLSKNFWTFKISNRCSREHLCFRKSQL